MKKNRLSTLGKLELEIMHVVWDKDQATVQEVKDALAKTHPGAYSTFLTMMRSLENKGFLKHDMHEDGRTYVYKPLVNREELSANIFQDIYERLFRSSSERLLNAIDALFQKEKITYEEVQNLKKLIAEKEEQNE